MQGNKKDPSRGYDVEEEITEDGPGGLQVILGDHPAWVGEKDAIRTQVHIRSMIAQLIAMRWVNVIKIIYSE